MGKKGRLSREERRQRKAEKKAKYHYESHAEMLESWERNFNTDAYWRVFFDGATGPTNPGQSGYGAVLYRDGVELDTRSQQIGHATCNQAEYRGLIAALEMCLEHGVDEVVVCGDSQLVIKQVFRHMGVKTPHLEPLRDRAQELASCFRFIADAWIPRDLNGRADELSAKDIPPTIRHTLASETDNREMRRCAKAIIDNLHIVRLKEMAFVLKMADQVEEPRGGMSPKQWKWLQDIEARIYNESAIDVARQMAPAPKFRLIKKQ